MGQAENAISIGEVLDELGITLPTVENESAPDSTPEEPTDADTEIDNTTNDDTEADSDESENDPSDPPDPSDDKTKSDDEPKDDDSDSDDEETPAEEEDRSVKKLNKRVDKLTARAKSAEEQASTLQAELAQAKEALAQAQPIIVQDVNDPLSDILSPADLEARLVSANTVLDQVPDLIAKAEMEGGEIEVPMGNGAVQKFTSAELRQRLQLAKAIVRGEPARRSYFAQRETFVAEAKQVYPEIFQEGSQLRQVMQATLRQYPALAKMPNLEIIIGDAMRGQAARFAEIEARSKAKPAAAAKPAPAKSVAAPKVVNPSAAPRAKSKPNALEALSKTGSREAAESFVAALLDD